MKCLTEEQLLASIDGGIAPNERLSLEHHLGGCATCRASLRELEALVSDVAALPEIDEDAHVKSIMARLDEKRPVPAVRKRPLWQIVGPAVSALAIAAGVAFFVRHGPAHRDERAFASRGGTTERSLERDVGVRVLTGTTALTPLAAGATVARDAAFSATFTNVHEKPVYLLLFAVDSKSDVHWLYPAYASSHENPASVALRRTTTETALETSVVLEGPAPGLLRFLSVVTDQPLHVLDIEGLRAGTLSKETLAQAYPSAAITALDVRVAGQP